MRSLHLLLHHRFVLIDWLVDRFADYLHSAGSASRCCKQSYQVLIPAYEAEHRDSMYFVAVEAESFPLERCTQQSHQHSRVF